MKDSTFTLPSSGAFTFANAIPIGNHLIRVVSASTGDSVLSYVSVLPGGTAYANLRLPGAIWAAP